MIVPQPVDFMTFTAAFVQINSLVRFTARTRSQKDLVVVPTESKVSIVPVLLMKISRLPKVLAMEAAKVMMASLSVMSVYETRCLLAYCLNPSWL